MSTFVDHFGPVAPNYVRFRPAYPPELFRFVAECANGRNLVWDCGTGGGQAAVAMTEYFDRVVATDASVAQLRNALPHERVTYVAARAEESGLADDSVDAITVAQALHWFDRERFYAEAKRTLRPGGILAAWTYGEFEIAEVRVSAIVHDYYHNIVGPYWPPERVFVNEGYRSIPLPFPELDTIPLEMRARFTLEEMLGYLGTWSASDRYARATGENPLVPLRERLSQVWGDPLLRKDIRWPLAVRIGRFAG